MSTTEPRRDAGSTSSGTRPGGRSARVQAAVHQAVAELVAEQGPDQLTIPAVAARAGVNPTTVYRRWGDVSQLLQSVAVTRLRPHDPAPDTGDLRADLTEWAERTLASITHPEGLALLRGSISRSASDRTPNPCLDARALQIATILAHADARGEPHPTQQEAMDHLLAPLFFRVLLALEPTDAPYARSLVADLLDRPPTPR
ncbi:TetR/AcrR family transcriptional regulator [Streptacidiphilus monticola]|uniref:TetR/AcrR family transcriptional regulator n=1 Tax=Streptacidiphilus monticola TaxID=2161674 RepID=A0ABW1FYV1_9ACTN